jgi:hypothetical protein
LNKVGTIQVIELYDGHGDEGGLKDDQVLHFWKKEREK